MKRLAQKAVKKRKTQRTKPEGRKIPNLLLTENGGKNVVVPPGEDLLRNLQFPSTILTLLKEGQKEKFIEFLANIRNNNNPDEEKMIEYLNRQPRLHSYESRGGCGKWVYNSVFMNDGQDRYEAVDSISFDVLGTFCPSCEMIRRLVELKPVHYEVPEEGQTLTPSKRGFTEHDWRLAHDPIVDLCVPDRSVGGKTFWATSPDKLRSILAMVTCSVDYDEIGCLVGGYKCGNRRVYAGETFFGDYEEMDFQRGVVDRLYSLETTRYFSDASIRIMVNEFKPFVGEGGMDETLYKPDLVINPLSRVIYNISVRITVGGAEHVFYCPEPESPPITFSELRSMEDFPETLELYPRFYTGFGGYGPIIAYSLLYLNESSGGEFTKVFQEDPEQFYKIAGLRISGEDQVRVFRERLMSYKREGYGNDFQSFLRGIRMCLGGLEIKK